jgi:two-component system, cell cycle sensor histidine kinase and response regulator CckA
MASLFRRALILVLILGTLHWVLDAVYYYAGIRAGEAEADGQTATTLLGALLTDVPGYVLLGRVTFLAVLILAMLVAVSYVRRVGQRDAVLRRQLESAGDLFSRHRQDGSFLYASSGFAMILGVEPAALLGCRELPGWRIDDPAALDAARGRALANDRPVAVTTCLRHEDGREVWLESVARRVTGAGARAQPEIIVISRDVTARQRTEAALALSERRLRLITESMQEILWLRVGDEIQYINSASERVSGLSPREMVRGGLEAWLPSIHPQDRDRMRLAIDQAARHHEPLDEEFRLVRADGQVRWLHARTVHVETGPDGRLETVGVAADITARRRAEDALRATVARYRLLYEAAHVGITITDLDGTILYANPSAAELYGAPSVKELLVHARRHEGIRTFYVDRRQRDRFVASLQADGRGRASGVMDMRRLDGAAIKLHVSCGLSVNPENGRPEIFAILDDVTERLQAEADLRRSEERYRRLVEFLPDGVLVHDGRRVVFGNQASARLFAADGADLATVGLEALAPPESLAYLSLPAAGTGEHRVAGPEEIWLRRLDGALFPASVTSLPMTDVTGPRTLTVVKDLTRLRRFGEEIAAQQEILSALVETMPLGIVAKDLDQDLRYVVWNTYMETELGLAKEDVLGRRDSEIFPAAVAQEMRRHDRAAADCGEPQDLGEISLQIGERHLDLHVVKVPVRDADGPIARIFSLVENVTDRKQLQARLQQARKMEAVGRLAGAVAHDFNNMLQVVQGYTEAIDQALDPTSVLHADTALVLTAVGRARELVQRLLTYSRYDALQPEMIDLNGVVGQLAALSRGLLPPTVTLSLRLAEDLPLIYADPQQLEQALLNLVLNARDALPGEGCIEIETSVSELGREFCATRPWARTGRYLQVTVRDNGCGIPPDARDHVYEPFYTTKGFGQGTGLGLATTYSVCKQHQGYIDFESELDVGTTFHVFLPVMVSEALHVPGPAESGARLRGRGELLLLVEDDDMVRALTRQMLVSSGYQVLEARDGEDAMEVFMAHAAEIQLLVLDVVMPRMDGRALYDNISELRPGVPVLFCSSYSAGILASEYMLQVGGSLLAKPYRAVDLLQRVRTMLDRGASGRG